MAAHDPLQRGHFNDHRRGQVSLRQRGRTLGRRQLLRTQSQHLANLRRQLLQPAVLIQHRTQFRLEDELAQLRQEVAQRSLDVLFVKELGV